MNGETLNIDTMSNPAYTPPLPHPTPSPSSDTSSWHGLDCGHMGCFLVQHACNPSREADMQHKEDPVPTVMAVPTLHLCCLGVQQ
jgi:hypothetical protein